MIAACKEGIMMVAGAPGNRFVNARGIRSGAGKLFTGHRIKALCRAYGLRSRFDRLKAHGLFTVDELGACLGCSAAAVRERRRRGTLRVKSYCVDGNGLAAPRAADTGDATLPVAVATTAPRQRSPLECGGTSD